MPNKPILLVEDDETLGELLKSFLELNNFEVRLYRDPEQAIQFFHMREYDLCILDVMMPGKDGFTLAREIKKIRPTQRLLFLTAKKMKEDMIRGYDLGAEDYIVKPFDSDLLLKKIQVIMRRGHPALTSDQTENAYRFGSIEYKPASRELIFENATCKLSPKEGELMLLLCKKMGGVMLRSEALQLIWGEESFFTNKTMDVYLARLRKYLESDSRVKIENVHSKGFRLVIAT
jgi:DNA-binding response OmpR family regulator